MIGMANKSAMNELNVSRCWWCEGDPLYIDYHDTQWGVPIADDQSLFEKVCLEGFQAGLSWLTILKKRDHFRRVFSDFDIQKVAKFTPKRVEKLLQDRGIVRHRGKIESTINNARQAIRVVEQHGSLGIFFWRFEPRSSPVVRAKQQVVAQTAESTALSRELKRMGWSFVGPTTCYALMQATGMVNDHLRDCHAWQRIEDLRRDFHRPGVQ